MPNNCNRRHSTIPLFVLILISANLALLSFTANAQFRAPGPENSGSTSNSSAVQNQNDSTNTQFDGLEVTVKRIVKDPTTEGGFRLILSVKDTGDDPRVVALIKPVTTLIDDLGNVYNAVDSTGIFICSYSKPWDADLKYCWQYVKNAPTKLTPNLATTLVLYFVPADTNFSKELAEIATVASLRSRFGYSSIDFKLLNQADIIINGIQLPQ